MNILKGWVELKLTSIETTLQAIPRPEYPRPDWERKDWLSLNGIWSFALNPKQAEQDGIVSMQHESAYDLNIQVPFSWANPLSGVQRNEQGTGWYRKIVKWQPSSSDAKVFLRFGAVDYLCEVWVNGMQAGLHAGGYGTFEFEVTEYWKPEAENIIVVRAEDNDNSYQARGKQKYGEIRGIWQPVWLEARPQNYIKLAKFNTSLDGTIEVSTTIEANQAGASDIAVSFDNAAVQHSEEVILQEGSNDIQFTFKVENPQYWSPEQPYLYEGEMKLASESGTDTVSTYFGIREIGTTLYGDRDYRWITLNGKPIYLNGVLDQSFHPEGHFTFPSDEDMKNEIYMMKRLGLNFARIHIKPEEPRKLYWADKLGLLIMEDMPCFWGNPDEQARASYEREALEIIERDYNHPSIFSWIMFNETWGLKTDDTAQESIRDWVPANRYLPETQEWVRSMYHWAKQLDKTRLVEDNSTCNWDHVESDLNTWHFYLNGYEILREHIKEVVDNTYIGSSFNYCGDNKQGDAPLMNSECGNVWGIEGGAGDSDLAWHYRYMMNEFRLHDKMCGFVFTEFRDVVNEFNGYYRLDGTEKRFGYEWFVPGMTVYDLHTPDFIVIDAPPCQTVHAGQLVEVPLLRSSFSDRYFGVILNLQWELWYDNLGVRHVADKGELKVTWEDYGVASLETIRMQMPDQDAVAVLAIRLLTEDGEVVTRNFTTFDVRSGISAGVYEGAQQCISIPVTQFSNHTFAYQWEALQGQKVNGAENGLFEYEVTLPSREEMPHIRSIDILFEASAKRLLARNKGEVFYAKSEISFMHGADPKTEQNPNTYYMTDEVRHESTIKLHVDDEIVESWLLPDNPADCRGVLSWHYQEVANKLEEAGSYGYLCSIELPARILCKLQEARKFKLTVQADEGGVALYGRNAGRYPIDIVVKYK